MFKSKKAISVVIATVLLMLITIITIGGFNGWFSEFTSSAIANINNQQTVYDSIEIESFSNSILYLKSGTDTILTSLKIIDGNDNIICEFSGSTKIDNTSLVGWWTFDSLEIHNSTHNKTVDISGNNNHGYLREDSSPELIRSKLGKGFEFDGTNQYIKVINDNSLNLGNNLTLISFIKNYQLPVSEDNLITHIIQKTQSYVLGFKHRFNLANNGSALWIYNGTSWNHSGDYNIYNTRYKLIAGKYDGISSKLFVNNELVSSQDINLDIFTSTEDIYFSTPYDSYRKLFQGIIDEIRIYNRTLTDNEIKQLFWYSIKPQQVGLNEIDLSSCNLNNGQPYNVQITTDTSILTETIINN